jgi:TrmH family RNA methyltransferase
LDDSRIVSLVKRFNAAGIDITLISQKVADSLSDTKTGQGIVVLAERPRRAGLADLNLSSNVPVVVFLEKVNTPSNLGAVIRTSEAAGINGLIVSQGAADPYSPKSLRASMGSAFRLPIVTGVTMAEALEWASGSGMIATAADISATVGHTNVDWRRPRLLVFGSEAHGLAQEDLDLMNELTLIEMNDKVESLNLAVSCGIILFEARRQNLK